MYLSTAENDCQEDVAKGWKRTDDMTTICISASYYFPPIIWLSRCFGDRDSTDRAWMTDEGSTEDARGKEAA
jgi:hypothetical protein